MRLVELSPERVCAWRLTVPEGHRFEATQALRQVLNRAVAWKLIEENPAKRGVPNPGRRCREQRPFDSWEQIGSLAELLGPTFGPMVVFAAATGLRPSELFALEHGDVDRRAGVAHVRRAYANGRVKHPKTRLSRRAVPLQGMAVEALDQLRAHVESPRLFPNSRGSYLDFRNFNRRHWKPIQRAVGIEPLRDLYDLRHTYATFALRAGVPVFALSRFMGTSIAMIDLHYGHLAVDSYQHAVSLLDALALERAVDAGWTPALGAAKPHSNTVSWPHKGRLPAGGGRSVDVEAATARDKRTRKGLISRNFAEPSDGLEPSTPSLPCDLGLDAAGTELAAVLVVVVAAVGGDPLGPSAGPANFAAYRRDTLYQRHELGDVVAVAAGDRQGERDPGRVYENVMLRAVSGSINRARARRVAPFFGRS
jgi:site-specific recombinase XerC